MNEIRIHFKVEDEIAPFEYIGVSTRLSGNADKLIIKSPIPLVEGKRYFGKGKVATEKYVGADQKSHLSTYIRLAESEILSNANYNQELNECNIIGVVCKHYPTRVTTTGIEITEFVLRYADGKKNYYIPCIAFMKAKLQIDDEIKVFGRLQSRVYRNTRGETKTAYELAVIRMNKEN